MREFGTASTSISAGNLGSQPSRSQPDPHLPLLSRRPASRKMLLPTEPLTSTPDAAGYHSISLLILPIMLSIIIRTGRDSNPIREASPTRDLDGKSEHGENDDFLRGRTQTTWPFGGRGGQAKHHVKPRGEGGMAENHVTFFPHFCFLLNKGIVIYCAR